MVAHQITVEEAIIRTERDLHRAVAQIQIKGSSLTSNEENQLAKMLQAKQIIHSLAEILKNFDVYTSLMLDVPAGDLSPYKILEMVEPHIKETSTLESVKLVKELLQ